ncbi:hypothetical protein JTE90_018632 [Oedothorax gibbosus]|uniref:Uncharacterized protein n=1 Tax=Oedothorax gibbosus TaxID=931172 RepID=A0AAV6UMF2_9ARAC|nr:hypothetical protein JTE90_018632 [Oedothorax gibbosus]
MVERVKAAMRVTRTTEKFSPKWVKLRLNITPYCLIVKKPLDKAGEWGFTHRAEEMAVFSETRESLTKSPQAAGTRPHLDTALGRPPPEGLACLGAI